MRLRRLLFPAMSVLMALGLAGLGLLAMPAGDGGPLAAWCRPEGRIDALRALVVVAPLLVAAALAALGWRIVRAQPPDTLVTHGIAVAALTGIMAFVLAFTLTPSGARLPEATLTDQDGRSFALQELRGSPALVGAIYSRCSTACPMALAELTRLLDALTPTERGELRVVMITLDPSNDSPERLHELATGHGLSTPSARFLTGEPSVVERVLDVLRIERRHDPKTGVIDHRAELLLVGDDGLVIARYPGVPEAQTALAAAVRGMLAKERERSPASSNSRSRALTATAGQQ